MPVDADLDVGGFEVAMDDAAFVRHLQRLGHLQGYRQGPVERHRTVFQQLCQILALGQLHDEQLLAVGFLDLVDTGDVRMIERRQNLGLTLEPGQALRIARHRLRQHLDRHFATQLGVLGAIHLTHAAFAQLGGDTEVREGLADHDRRRIVHGPAAWRSAFVSDY